MNRKIFIEINVDYIDGWAGGKTIVKGVRSYDLANIKSFYPIENDQTKIEFYEGPYIVSTDSYDVFVKYMSHSLRNI